MNTYRILVGMDEDAHSAVFFLDLVHLCVRVNLEDLEGVEVPVRRARPEQAVDLLSGGEDGVLELGLLQVLVERVKVGGRLCAAATGGGTTTGRVRRHGCSRRRETFRVNFRVKQ